LAVARFMMACSFMAMRGPGSATRVLTSTSGPLDDATAMVTSVALSVAHRAWSQGVTAGGAGDAVCRRGGCARRDAAGLPRVPLPRHQP
jgi:hypothetical protein